MDFRKTLCFIHKNIMSKVILKYHVSMLSCPSVHPTYPKIHFRITRTVNPLSHLYINRKFQKYVSFSIALVTERLLWDLSLLHLKTMNGVISWYLFDLQTKLLKGVLRSGLLQPLVINTTGFSLGKIWVTSYLHLPLRITFCRISPWN